MGEGRYVISEVVKLTNIKPHTIRYWEDELELMIDRNNMGHRYYTNENIEMLMKIKQLKDKGFQLKAIKMLIPDIHHIDDLDSEQVLELKDELNSKVEEHSERVDMDIDKVDVYVGGRAVGKQKESTGLTEASKQETVAVQHSEKMEQFKQIMNELILEALRENNLEISSSVSSQVSENVIKEIDYMLRMKEEREDERFRKLDETIRGVQKSRQEVAVSSSKEKKRRKKRLFSSK